jgi:hypothetical protein
VADAQAAADAHAQLIKVVPHILLQH